jgi:hypothetical protein
MSKVDISIFSKGGHILSLAAKPRTLLDKFD